MKKRILSILLCVMLFASLIPMSASADGFKYSGNCTVNDAGVLVVSGDAEISGSTGKSIIIESNAGNVKLNSVSADVITVSGGNVSAVGGISANSIAIKGGKLSVSGASGLYANESVKINGGTVYAVGESEYGIYASGAISVDGGTVTATGAKAAVCTADGKLSCTLPVQRGRIYSGTGLYEVKISGGTYVIGSNTATMVWLSNSEPCTHKNTEAQNAVQATCTAGGYTGDIVCKDCLAMVKKGSEIKELGHLYSNGKCVRCGKNEPIAHFTDTDGLIKNYREAISWAVENGVTTGYKMPNGTYEFRPNNNCTRGHVVTFIWRANGSPEPATKSNPFKDVSASSPFYKAILWAAEKGITTGYSDGTFRPDAPCTRAHVVTFIWRSEGKPAYTQKASLTDVGGLNKDFTNAIYWAAQEGVTTGYYDNTFRPNNICTRAQVVTFIYRDMT